MSEPESPVSTIFDVQRTATRQGEQAIKQGMQVQETTGMLLLNGLRMQESLQRQSFEVAQQATHSYLGAVQALLGGAESPGQRRTVDEAFQRLKETQAQFYGTLERELQRGIDSFDELSEEYRDALDQQTDQQLETLRTMEDQSVEGFDEFTRQLRQQFQRTQEIQNRLDDQFEQQAQEIEQLLQRQTEQTEQFQQQLEQQAQRMQRRTEGGAQPVGEQRAQTRHLDDLEGIGTTYRNDLEEAGITTVADLAGADVGTVAAAADVSEEQAREWIEQAGA